LEDALGRMGGARPQADAQEHATLPFEIIVDHWDPSRKQYRFETFCYGPKRCSLYRAGPTRKVPGRKGMWWEEEDWVDEDATSHRGPDD